jgi:hypothetical protein
MEQLLIHLYYDPSLALVPLNHPDQTQEARGRLPTGADGRRRSELKRKAKIRRE